MKTMLVMVAAMLIAGVAFAGSTNTVTNAVGQVFTVIVDNSGLHISGAGTTPGLPASDSRDSVSALGAQLAPKTADTDTTTYTPRDIGDMLIGMWQNTTNGVWVATGKTTNDWKQVYP